MTPRETNVAFGPCSPARPGRSLPRLSGAARLRVRGIETTSMPTPIRGRSALSASGCSPTMSRPTRSRDRERDRVHVPLATGFAPVQAGQGLRNRLCGDRERGFHPFPGPEDGLVRIRLQVGVALGGLEALMAKEVLDLVEGDPFLDQP